jgi:hypothetical protein
MSDTGQSLCRDPLPCCRSPVSVIKLTRITVRQKALGEDFCDCTHILGFFVFRPEAFLCGATNARIGL